MSKITLDALKEQVPKKYRKLVDQETVDNINELASDPEYGEEFRDSVITHTKILDGTEKWSMKNYIDAIKFYSLTAAGNSQVEAYCKVFPDRLQSRLDRDQDKSYMNGEASRFNATDLVNRIRQQALVPLHLVNQGTTQLAINQLTNLMMNARSDVAKVSAATALLKELRPPEAQQIDLQIGLNDDARAAQDKQNNQLLEIANNQRRLLESGMTLDEVQSIHIKKEEVIEADLDE